MNKNILEFFSKPDGQKITTKKEWEENRDFFKNQIIDLLYGGLPPAPERLEIEELCHAVLKLWPDTPLLHSCKLHCERGQKSFGFGVRLYTPQGDGPFPVLILGDGCWGYGSEEVVKEFLNLGIAVLQFNRTEMAKDTGSAGAPVPGWRERVGGLYDLYPGLKFGALSAWAWGYHRCVDFLFDLPYIDSSKIAVSGHSRGGKAVLLAAAADKRITLINDNASGAGGSALSSFVPKGGETLHVVLGNFPNWFASDFSLPETGVEALAFDQHHLLASLAPRPVLLTYADEDFWSNPPGMIRNVEITTGVYELYGKRENLHYHIRKGGHSHTPNDFQVLRKFIRAHWQ